MAFLQYKTRDGNSPQGIPRVYFCCHPEDFDRCFGPISDEILDIQNCAIWYTDGVAIREEAFLADLKQMQLFVMPVTMNLLCTANDALDIDFRFAVENHIPVLPLMQESGLEELFNSKCGDLQFLDKNNGDATSIRYEEKLQKYLASVLIGDELAEKIRAAFDGYVFLSYRKKDRKYAQELMRLIHKNGFCRDIAIWYDEFLTPGENFNASIKEALQKSGLFVLTVTPNLVNEANYIMTTEYPMAKQEGKPILPAELVPTDRSQLSEKYTDVPSPTDAHNAAELSEALLAAVKQMDIRENNHSPEHNYFIGLAYLGGVDVEIDCALAVELITLAAEAGLPNAMEKLIDIYENGIGVACDYSKVVFWQRKLYEHIKKLDAEAISDEIIRKYDNVVWGLSDNLKRMGSGDEAAAMKQEYYTFLETFAATHYQENPVALAEAFGDISRFYSSIGSDEKAKVYAQKAFDLFRQRSWEWDKKNIWFFMDIARRMLRYCESNELEDLLEAIRRIVEAITASVQNRALLSDVYEAYADMLKEAKIFSQAESYYKNACSLLATEIDFSQDRTIRRLFDLLRRLKNLKQAEEKEEEALEYARQIVDLRLQYVEALEAAIEQTPYTMQLQAEQYGEIARHYRLTQAFSEALHYSEKCCENLEKYASQALTAEKAKVLELSYCDLLSIYKSKERFSGQLSEEEKQKRTWLVKKQIKLLLFLLEHYKKEQTVVAGINRVGHTLTELVEAYLYLGQTEEAKQYSEEKLRISLARFDRTRFLSDAYNAYYDLSDFYKKIGQHQKAISSFLQGLAYEEQEIKGHLSQDNQERLAYQYRKVGEYCFRVDLFDKGYTYFTKALQIYIAVHKAVNNRETARSLFLALWSFYGYIEKKHPDGAAFLKNKMEALKKEWPDLL